MTLVVIVILTITILAGYLSSYFIKTSEDFFTASQGLGVFNLTGMLMGAIIGGASTVGTSQMAFERGIGAIWFTFGLVIASISLNLVYGHLLDKKEKPSTLTGIIGDSYGEKAGLVASVILILGMFIHINGQVIASVSVIHNIVPFSTPITILFTVAIIVLYVVFGGFWGSTIVGSLKTVLLYGSSIVIGGILLLKYQAFGEIMHSYSGSYMNPFSKGFLKDLSLPLSTVLGVLSTQIYFQSAMAAKSRFVLKRTGMLTAFLIAPVGIVSVTIGMFMHLHHPEIIARDSFMLFAKWYLHPVIGGAAIAAVVISSVATAAGLLLGISTIMVKDVFKVSKERAILGVTRMTLLIVASLVFMIVITMDQSMILNWGFLSMVFRATPILVPVVFALYSLSSVKSSFAYVVIGPCLSVLWILLGLDKVSSIYIGILGSIIYMVLNKSKVSKQRENISDLNDKKCDI